MPNTPGVASFAMTSSPSTVSTTLLSILRDDLNIDLTRVTPDARLVDDVGLDSVAFAVGMVAIEERLESHCRRGALDVRHGRRTGGSDRGQIPR